MICRITRSQPLDPISKNLGGLVGGSRGANRPMTGKIPLLDSGEQSRRGRGPSTVAGIRP